jgi:hypothetical protein
LFYYFEIYRYFEREKRKCEALYCMGGGRRDVFSSFESSLVVQLVLEKGDALGSENVKFQDMDFVTSRERS